MTEEKEFDYENYIKRRLREIDDLDERRYAKELLLGSLGELAAWTEEKYKALEQRVREELDNPWENFQISMTIIDKADYDPINPFWCPVCEEDLKPPKGSGRITIYLMADDTECQSFMEQGKASATDRETGQQLCYRIMKPERYQVCMERLYTLFIRNHVPWQTVQTGHLERFFDLVPDESVSDKAQPVFQWGDWASCVRQDIIPLWNMQEKALQSQEFRHPCIDEVVYEHVYYVGEYGNNTDGCLVDAGDNVRSIRYEKNKVILQTNKEIPGDISICRLHQGDRGNSYGYHYPVLSNHRQDNFAARYLHHAGNFIQTPAELMRKIEELSGGFQIEVTGYEIRQKGNVSGLLEGDMNHFIGTQVFARDQRSLLVFCFRREGQDDACDYLYKSQLRYILSQLQLEFMEYRCVGGFE